MSNVIAYADDIVVLAPSAKGLQILVDILVKELKDLNLSINSDKSACMIFTTKNDYRGNKCMISLDNDILKVVLDINYLGFIIDFNFNNNFDVLRCRNRFYNEFNCILRKFSNASIEVFLKLFSSYCLNFYGDELWFLNSKCSIPLKQFAIGHHKAIKKILI